jgi:hypothetical protein
MHTISFLAKVRVMPSKYDPELRSKAVGLAEHRDDYPSKFEALTAAEFPDSDPPDAEYFLLFGEDHGWVFFRALSRLKFNDEPVDDFTVDAISVDVEPYGSGYMEPSNSFDRLSRRDDIGG